jgi:hypothetical protein
MASTPIAVHFDEARLADRLVKVQLEAAAVCAEQVTEALNSVDLPGVGEYKRGFADGLMRARALTEHAAAGFRAAKGEIR